MTSTLRNGEVGNTRQRRDRGGKGFGFFGITAVINTIPKLDFEVVECGRYMYKFRCVL
ncbi:hypothetical protein M378DRAFT_855065 [Amanita muscaria Koide BX008]|uniref:Uncharacterized protein n=1 Tax=Amanita muscaria (strain Koide BX008) TaxID=946122 RepID=A0A0C2T4H1_AMAMK|nr:hypothetical protein M378DRAFT_855065 [Amanita muscaria Koide BX008]